MIHVRSLNSTVATPPLSGMLWRWGQNCVVCLSFLSMNKMIKKDLEKFTVVSLPEEAIGYAKIKNQLRKRGKLIDEFDMIIAGQALDENLVVITDNLEHFERIDGLKVENWKER